MILAGLLLLGIGAIDVVRGAAERRATQAVAWSAVFVGLVVLGVIMGGPAEGFLAVAATGLWMWLFPRGEPARAGVWPAVGLAVIAAVAVVADDGHGGAGPLERVWHVQAPFGPVAVELVVLVAGVLCFLAESANVVVRAALAGERIVPDASAPGASGDEAERRGEATLFRGGRLIGPLERVLVFALTLSGAFTLLAAVLAAKGIVRFPEISRGSGGSRAEYFLVGSLVSWVTALAGAFLVWWATG